VETRPPGATVSVAGSARGKSPLDVDLARGSAPVRLTVTRRGFAEVSQDIVPDTPRAVLLVLPKAPVRRASPPAAASSTVPEFRRFN
jgi:hypothetical protein